jgi:hypothetical protein
MVKDEVWTHSGWLYKRSRVGQKYKRRFFILKPKMLYYSAEEPKGSSTALLGAIALNTVQSREEEGGELGQYRFVIITDNRTYYVYSITKDDRDKWISQLNSGPLGASAPSQSPSVEQSEPPVSALPNLADVSELPVSTFDLRESTEDASRFEFDSDDGDSDTSSVLSTTEMSRTESKYYKKFGLAPPDQMQRSQTPILPPSMGSINSSLDTFPSQNQARNPYSGAGRAPEAAALLPKGAARRPPKRQEESTCSCNLL